MPHHYPYGVVLSCLCGCGETASPGRWYLQGHDSKHISKAGKAIVAGDALTAWFVSMPSEYQRARLKRYLDRRGVDTAQALANEATH